MIKLKIRWLILVEMTFQVFLMSCRDHMPERTQMPRFESDTVNDSTLNGVVDFYTHNYDLSSEKTYKRGVLDGPATYYYPGNQLKQTLNYVGGKEAGEHTVFDSLGNIIYKDYYFDGKTLGPVYTYKGNKISDYCFLDFSLGVLNHYSYNNGKIDTLTDSLLVAHLRSVMLDGVLHYLLFVYTPYPPYVSCNYKVYLLDKKNKVSNLVNLPKDAPFYETFLDSARMGSQYVVERDTYDSTTGKKLVAMRKM